ncbi:MAG: Undecaprenyl-phosphate glycophosphotransferase [uncultured Rubrobacteraceae bacterium]|uniref:Undecaprenyl-phosphate glycophosphotransferase n=1 Tax=uncultured Rubrobacteraceae bacterium TaxID=349277 RepID=A0A6J4QED8_9ACTN|nr:MAG: Undecaprenyl-phosphate glycophosphotransferase [uncultured Rubrobacteraceae bacterium]
MRILKNIPKRLLGLKTLRRTLSVVVLALLDGAALLFGLLGAVRLLDGAGGDRMLSLFPLLIGGWVVVCAAFRLYDRAPVRRNPGALIGSSACWAGLALLGAAVYPESGLGLAGVLLSALLAFVFAGALRFLFEWGVARVYRRGLGQTPVLVAGREQDRARVSRTMGRAGGAYVLAGEVDLVGSGADLAALRAALDRTGARIVVLAGAERLPDDELLELLHSVRLRGVPLRVAPGALALMRGRTILSEGMGMPLLEVRYPRLDNSQRALKRALDVAVSVAGLLVISPLLLAIALAVRLDSPGPVLFRQKRVGADEKTFVCLMFRSMRADAEGLQEEMEEMNEAEGPVFKIRHDPRVTRVGRSLRRWSLDELPQLVNVLKGEMSLVGPRPLPVRDFLRMEEEHKRRLGAVPGMTGYWQISGRSDLSFEDMVRLDLYYMENWSLSFDLKIILKTLGAVRRREGAY